mgnify:CR=1 FL=1
MRRHPAYIIFMSILVLLLLIGIGLMSNCGMAAKMFEALYEAGINIQMINTSEIRVSVLLDEEDVNRAVKAIHDKFFDVI